MNHRKQPALPTLPTPNAYLYSNCIFMQTRHPAAKKRRFLPKTWRLFGKTWRLFGETRHPLPIAYLSTTQVSVRCRFFREPAPKTALTLRGLCQKCQKCGLFPCFTIVPPEVPPCTLYPSPGMGKSISTMSL